MIQVASILFKIGAICSVLNFWDQQPCRCMETCMLHRTVICQPYIFELKHCMQAVNILLFPKWNQHPCSHTFKWNTHSNLFWPEIKFLTYALHEMKILLVFKSNHQPCHQVFSWNQNSNLFWPGIKVFELRYCVKWRFCLFFSQINSLAIKSLREIKILTYFDLESRFLSVGAA